VSDQQASKSESPDAAPTPSPQSDVEAFIVDVMGMADTLELLAEEQARVLRGVASEMADQIRRRAAQLLIIATKN
jgi:hypothetical protein